MSVRAIRKRKAAMREEKRIATSTGYGVALYPTSNLAAANHNVIGGKPLRVRLTPVAHSSSRVGRLYQADVPPPLSAEARAALLARPEHDRIGVLVRDPVAADRAARVDAATVQRLSE